jgi:hypothetical protein
MSGSLEHFAPILQVLERTFRLLERRVPPPKRRVGKDGFVFRCVECTIHQAIVQKLARIISGLYAIQTLLEKGLFQEQGVIQRTIDEIQEDVIFLSLGIIRLHLHPCITVTSNTFMLKSSPILQKLSNPIKVGAWSGEPKFATM